MGEFEGLLSGFEVEKGDVSQVNCDGFGSNNLRASNGPRSVVD